MGSFENVIGNKYGEYVVLEEFEPHITPNGSKKRMIKAQCSCGEIVVAQLPVIKSAKMCRKCKGKAQRIDITGHRYGKLVVTSMADDYISPAGHRLSQCNCLCECGNTFVVAMSSLVTGSTKSCGCSHNTRGLLKDNPDLVRKYDFNKNNEIGLNFDKLTARSSKKAWWKCDECGNIWFATIASQNDEKKHGCPYCSGRNVIVGKTDLLSQYPDVAKEWNYKKNGDLKPSDISSKSSIKVWWKCEEGHEWKAVVSNRTKNQTGCPKCNIENVNSFCEQAVFYYIKQAFPDAINGDSHIGMELDIYIPSIRVAIEYDGEAWHESKKKIQLDEQKNSLCKEKGITLVRIREPRLSPIDNCVSFVRSDSTTNTSLNNVIVELLDYLKINDVMVDIDTDGARILEQYATKKYENSLAVCNPEVASEWHPVRNGTLTPDKVSKSTNKKVWWLGKCGHEWLMAVSDRTSKASIRKDGKKHKPQGCPYCNSKRILIGFNDLQTTNPELASEWHPTKNGTLQSSDVQAGSNRQVWWLGKCGHEWQASINSRNGRNLGCPYCSHHRVLSGFNDLATHRPDIAEEWNYKKNEGLTDKKGNDISTPDKVTYASGHKVWWKCNCCNHEWQASIADRKQNHGCPVCSLMNRRLPDIFRGTSQVFGKGQKSMRPRKG